MEVNDETYYANNGRVKLHIAEGIELCGFLGSRHFRV